MTLSLKIKSCAKKTVEQMVKKIEKAYKKSYEQGLTAVAFYAPCIAKTDKALADKLVNESRSTQSMNKKPASQLQHRFERKGTMVVGLLCVRSA